LKATKVKEGFGRKCESWCECESVSEEKRSGNEMGILTPTLTPALFSAPLTAESCNWMKDLLIIKSGYLNSNFDLIGL
jgi:hypothetical protein